MIINCKECGDLMAWNFVGVCRRCNPKRGKE